MSLKQLNAAATRFPDYMVQAKQGASYVDHAVITQRLMQVFGWFDQEIAQVIRGSVPAWKTPDHAKYRPPLDDVVTGCVLRITVHTDEGPRVVEEVGMVEFPHNHDQDGSRLKFAVSDAIKRCAMRLGVGLHLWAQGLYTLDASTAKMLEKHDEEPDAEVPDAPDPTSLPVDPDTPTAEGDEPEERPAEDPVPYAEPDAAADVREQELHEVLAKLDVRFVGTLDLDAMVEYVRAGDEQLVKALETVQDRLQRWHEAQEQEPEGDGTPEEPAADTAHCGGTTKAGKPCSNPPGDSGYCHLHEPDAEEAVVISDEPAEVAGPDELPTHVKVFTLRFEVPPRDYYEGGYAEALKRAHMFAHELTQLDDAEEFAAHLDTEGVLGKSIQFVARSAEAYDKALERLHLRRDQWTP